MGSKFLPLQDKGIFHSLPTFSPEIKDLTAIVTGANGISGFHTMRVLLEAPKRWKKIYAISRRPPPKEMMELLPADQRSRVEHVASDFFSKPEDIAKELTEKKVTADVIFFYSYLQPKPDPGARAWSNAEALVKTNVTLLCNFLSALRIASITPKRFLLQTGAKNYGGHLGPTLNPPVESDPRVGIEPNFYYPQEDALFEYCSETGAKWNVIRPAWIIGAVVNAQMNAMYGVGVYAAVQAHLGKTLEFPGSITDWTQEHAHSTAMLTSYLSEWAVLEDACENQAFNASDTAWTTWARFWPELARWFGAKDVGKPELDESKFKTLEMPYNPPPLGYGPPGRYKHTWTFVGWAQEPENHKAWKEIMAKHGLDMDPFEDIDGNFTFADAATWIAVRATLSMNKARLLGWCGFVDVAESVFLTFQEMYKLKMLPPAVVEKARPYV